MFPGMTQPLYSCDITPPSCERTPGDDPDSSDLTDPADSFPESGSRAISHHSHRFFESTCEIADPAAQPTETW